MSAKTESTSNGQHADDADALAARAKTVIDDNIASARDAVETFAGEAKNEVRKISDQTTQFVKDNPGIALAGALGLGIIVGLAMRSR